MCGRFTLWADEEEILQRFGVTRLLAMREPSWNISPGSPVTVITERLEPTPDMVRTLAETGERTAELMEWGLRPHWAPEGRRPHVNARAETVTEKPTFRAASLRRRCLVPANGHYEWEHHEGAARGGRRLATPWFFHDPQHTVLAYAGIHEERVDPRTGELRSGLSILTRPAPDEHGRIHDRCPLILPSDFWDAWLDAGVTDPRVVRGLIEAVPAPQLVAQEVDPRVGSITNDGPWLLAPSAPTDTAERSARHNGSPCDPWGPSLQSGALFDL